MKNYRGGGSSLREAVTAAVGRTGGVPVVEEGFAGVPEVTALVGQRYALRRDGEFEFNLGGTPAKGNDLLIDTVTFALSAVARGTAPVGNNVVLGRITAVPGNPNTGKSTDPEPAAGKIWATIGRDGQS